MSKRKMFVGGYSYCHVGCETHDTPGKTWVLSVAPTLSEDVGVPPLLPRLSRRVSLLPLRQRLLLWIEY